MKRFYLLLSLILSSIFAFSQNVGINSASPSEKLDVNGAIRVGNTSSNNAGSIRYITATQRFQINIGGTWYNVATEDQAYISNFSFNPTTNELTITEGSNTHTVDLDDLQDLDDQTISLSGSTLSIQNGNSVDLSSFLDNTDAQTLSLSSNTLGISGGNSVSLSSYLDNTDNQNLSLSGNSLSISGGTGVTLAGYLDNTDDQQISYNSTTNVVTLESGGTINLSDLQDNTDSQTLNLSGNTLSISGGNNLSLAGFTNTDAQTLSLSGNTLAISGGNNVSLSSYLDNTDSQNLGLSGNNLTISGGTSVSLAGYLDNTDDQQISLSGNILTLESGGSVNLSSFMDDTDNQTLSQVYQEGGNDVQLNSTDGDVRFYRGTATEILTMREGNGYVGIGTINPQRKLHVQDGGEISLLQGSSISTNSQAGIYWHTGTDYAIYRTPGAWNSPDYQQLRIQWPTGMILDPGSSYGKSYVDIIGAGLRVTSGNVGIGLTATQFKLDVFGSAADNARIGRAELGGWPANSSYAYFGNQGLDHSNSGNYALLQAGDGTTFINGASGTTMYFRNANNTLMYLLSNGNFGIGVSPSQKLDINGQIRIRGGSPGNGKILVSDANGVGTWTAASSVADNLGNHTATTNLNMNDRQLQNVNGIQGIDWDDNTGGTDNKYRILFRDGAHQFYNGGVVVGNYGNGTWSDLADGTLIVENNVGIATTSPTERLDVNGNVKADNIWMKVFDGNISGVTSYTVTGLNGNTQKMFKVVFQGTLSAGGSDRHILIRPNSSSSPYKCYAVYDGDAGGSDWNTSGFFVGRNGWGQNADFSFEYIISAQTGRRRVGYGNSTFYHPSSNRILGFGRASGAWNNTGTNITSLRILPTGGTLTGRLMVFALQ